MSTILGPAQVGDGQKRADRTHQRHSLPGGAFKGVLPYLLSDDRKPLQQTVRTYEFLNPDMDQDVCRIAGSTTCPLLGRDGPLPEARMISGFSLWFSSLFTGWLFRPAGCTAAARCFGWVKQCREATLDVLSTVKVYRFHDTMKSAAGATCQRLPKSVSVAPNPLAAVFFPEFSKNSS